MVARFTARAARLRAERDNSPVIDFPDEFLTDSALTEIANGERRLFRENMKTLSVQKEQITNRIKQFQKEIPNLDNDSLNEARRGFAYCMFALGLRLDIPKSEKSNFSIASFLKDKP